MKSVYNFVVTPKGERYNNSKKIGDTNLILNTEIFNHQYINRNATVISTPIIGDTKINIGNEVIVHHNVFRRWHNVKGVEKNSKSYFDEKTYIVNPDQIFLYKQNNKWIAPEGYCFVKPIISNNILLNEKEIPLRGIIKHVDKNLKDIYKEDLVGFTPSSEYEFIIDGERMYRVPTNSISIKYERQGNEKEYNPSWLQSG